VNKLTSLLGVLAVVAIGIVFVFSFQPGSGVNQMKEGPDCAAEVRGTCIRDNHFMASYRLLAPGNADGARLRSMRLKTQTMDGLVERQLLADDARRLGLGVSEEDISRELSAGRFRVSLPAEKIRQYGYALGLSEDGVRLVQVTDRKTGQFDPKSYEKAVRQRAHMAPPDFREYQREEILAARVRDLVRSRARVGEGEARAQFAREKSTATLSYVRFHKGWFADEAIDTSTAAVTAWTEKNRDEVDKVWNQRKAQLGECRVVQHILRKLDPESPTPLEDQEKAAREALDGAKKRADGGEDFAKIAAELSEAPSASRGGDEGCVAKGRLPKPIETVIFDMKKEGEMTSIVETKEGLHLLRLAKLATGPEAERLGREQVAREVYLAHETERLSAEAAKAVRAAAAGGKTLEDALTAWRATLPPKPAVETGDKKKKKKGEEGAKPKDEKDEDKKAAPPMEPVVETTLPFGESGDPIDGLRPGQNMAAIAFGLQKPGDVPGDVVALEDGYAVVALKEKKVASDDEWKEQKDFYLAAMRGAKQQDALVGYVRRLRAAAQADIKVNTTFTKESDAKQGDDPDLADEPTE
jgi:peptidyl-prolyl cis-trans isomerase D